MNFKRWTGGTLGLLALGSFAWACSSKSDDCSANKDCGAYNGGASGVGTGGAGGSGGASGRGGSSGTSGGSGKAGASGDAGSSGDAGAAGAASTCDGTLSPDVDGCVISDDYGVFVSPAGSDSDGEGTIEKPYATLTKALTSVDAINRIYVCAADYSEPKTLQIPSGVSIYGGFTCADGKWAYDATSKASFQPSDPIGVDIESADSVTLQDVLIKADDATSPSASSFGMMVVNSTNVLLKGVTIQAGKGAAGSSGAPGASGSDGTASTATQNGSPASCSNAPASQPGGVSIPKICGSQGGNGGTGFAATGYSPLQDGAGGFLVEPTNGGKGSNTSGQNGGVGQPGANGSSGERGVAAKDIGGFQATGYSAANGGAGTVGQPGQGGGGGGSSLGKANCVGASGGAGGMGGCGGDPGAGGSGGGASIALFSWNSDIVIDGGALTALAGGGGGSGGKGHTGGNGVAGGQGGGPETPNAIGKGGTGGDGGIGGNGGNAAGGTGGPSISLAYKGKEPNKKNTPAFNHAGTGGALGTGGQLGDDSMKWGPNGSVGQAADEYLVP